MNTQPTRPLGSKKLGLDDAPAAGGAVRIRSGVKAGATSYGK